MKKLIALLEELWVAVTFAEAGVVYENTEVQDLQLQPQEEVRIHTA